MKNSCWCWSAVVLGLAVVCPSGGVAVAEQDPCAVAQVLDHVLRLCDEAEARMPLAIRTGETIARRHMAGGAIGVLWSNGCLGPELYGRSGNIMHIGYDRIWKKERSADEVLQDVTLVGMEWPPWPAAQKLVDQARERSAYLVGFGPLAHAGLAGMEDAFDVFFDTGFGANDQVVDLGEGRRAGHLNHVANALHGWMVMAETTAALTRNARMPVMWKSYSHADGRSWGKDYFGKQQFHDGDVAVPPQPAGRLASAYLGRIREYIVQLKQEQTAHLQEAAGLIFAEHQQGRKTRVAWAGHMPEAYVGRLEDQDWAHAVQLHLFLAGQRQQFRRQVPDGALVLVLGSQGLDPLGPPLFREKGSRLICMTGRHPDASWQMPAEALVNIDLIWPFGDACVDIEGYPFPVFAPSGIMQAAAYAALCAQVEWLRWRDADATNRLTTAR